MKQCIYTILFSLIAILSFHANEKPIKERLRDRAFPSIFMAWAQADNRPHLTQWQNIAQHDLAFLSTATLQLKWDHIHDGLATTFTQDSIIQANTIRKKLLSINPNLILLVEIRYRDAWDGFIPKDHPWWMRNEKGERVKGWEEGRFYKLDYTLPAYRNHVARRAKAAIETGVVDGIMLDWWWDDNGRLALIKQIRKVVGKRALILANANERKIPLTAPYINGLFMECTQTKTKRHWQRIADTLLWAEKHLRPPQINCLETWYANSRQDYNRMRATTCLTLTHSNGFTLFSDPNTLPTGDHKHNWYPFWDTNLGRPDNAAHMEKDGASLREFENGTVVYNPLGNKSFTIRFSTKKKRVSTGEVGTNFTIPALDGDIFMDME